MERLVIYVPSCRFKCGGSVGDVALKYCFTSEINAIRYIKNFNLFNAGLLEIAKSFGFSENDELTINDTYNSKGNVRVFSLTHTKSECTLTFTFSIQTVITLV